MTETVAQGGGLVAGRYRLVRALGAGGMGQVWYAHDVTLNRNVAIKQVQLAPNLSESERRDRVERAFREARNAARVSSHPNIVTVHDVVDDGGAPWIVMEYIEARDLAQLVVERGPMAPAEAVRIATAVLDALIAIHSAGIIHRDIKPANILVTGDGQVLLTDFGIAVQEGDATMTATGAVIATPEYMPPERANGQPATTASDLFSFGATIYELVEGISPFRGQTPTATFKALLLDEPRNPQRAGALAPLLYDLLRKDPAHRPSAQQARQALAALEAAPLTVPAPLSSAPVTEPASWPNPMFVGGGSPAVPPAYAPQATGTGRGIRVLIALGVQVVVVAVPTIVLYIGVPIGLAFWILGLATVAVFTLLGAIRSCVQARGSRLNPLGASMIALATGFVSFVVIGKAIYPGVLHLADPQFTVLLVLLALIGAFSFVLTLARLERRHVRHNGPNR